MRAPVYTRDKEVAVTLPEGDSYRVEPGVKDKERFPSLIGSVLAKAVGWPILWVVLAVILIVPSASFLVLAFSPKLFGQGSSYFTLSNFIQGLQGVTLQGMRDSVVVGLVAAVLATAVGAFLAYVLQRTTLRGRSLVSVGIWGTLLLPSYVIAVGWQVLLDRGGVLSSVHLYSPTLLNLFFGPGGYALILAIKGVPFAYLALSGPIAALGSSYEEAIRVHGGRRSDLLKTLTPIILPAIFSSLVIVFAESIADFGTAAVIAPNAHFPVATYMLYVSLSSYPANFPLAAVIGWLLVSTLALALLAQNRALKRRGFGTLGGKSGVAKVKKLGGLGQLGYGLLVALFLSISLGIPILGAIASSLLKPLSSMALSNLSLFAYRSVFSLQGFSSSVVFSMKMAAITALLGTVLAVLVARRLTNGRLGIFGRLLDVTVLVAVALPGLVLAAGYIFTYNLPLLDRMGVHLYGTTTVLEMAYLAGALPSSSRVLVGPMAQLRSSLLEAARVHGSGPWRSWSKAVLPLVAPSILRAALLTFAGTFLELPASELLSPPGVTPVSVAIVQVLNKSDLYQGTALSIVALGIDLGVIAAAIVLFRVFAPKGWRRVGGRVI